MARNVETTLTTSELATVCYWSPRLFEALTDGSMVLLSYVKRDGTDSTSTGSLVAVIGNESNLSVVCETADKGPRTINVRNILGMSHVDG